MDANAELIRERKARAVRAALDMVTGIVADKPMHERREIIVRRVLGDTAFALMADRGLDAVTPAAIAKATHLPQVTFRGCFSGVEEAVLSGMVRRLASTTDVIRDRPADEPLWDSIAEVLPCAVGGYLGRPEDAVVLMRALRTDPALLARQRAAVVHGHWVFIEMIVERTGSIAEGGLAAQLLAAVVAAALRTSIDVWATGGTGRALPDLIQETVAQVRAGLPDLHVVRRRQSSG